MDEIVVAAGMISSFKKDQAGTKPAFRQMPALHSQAVRCQQEDAFL